MWLCGSIRFSLRIGKSQSAAAASLSAPTEDERTPTEYPSTGGLQILLQQTFLRESFRSFVKNTWVVVFSADTTPLFRNNARQWALNCVDFLTDVRDFNLMHNNSIFQCYRAHHIFEKYIMHGAVLQVRSRLATTIFRKQPRLFSLNSHTKHI